MNPEQLLNAVETCIAERTPLDCKLWVICWHENRLKCLPSRAVKNDGNCFGTFSSEDLKKGLTVEQWRSVAKNITNFFEQKEKMSVTQRSGSTTIAELARQQGTHVLR